MHGCGSVITRALGLALLVSAFASLGGCPRNQLLLGNDTRDAGASSAAGHPPPQPNDAGAAHDAGKDASKPLDAGPGSVSCGSRGQAPCSQSEYCHFPVSAQCGATDSPGVCETPPQICSTLYAAVCGCDGKTYPNSCSASAARVSVAAAGACAGTAPSDDAGPSGPSCGGLQGASCAASEYCNYALDAQCGAADQTGVCTKIPSACAADNNQVCGCDDKTYSHACAAASAGISVASKGPCAADGGVGQSCGGRAKSCAKGQYCDYPVSALCGRADAMGTCATIPSACSKELRQVCGCDGTTYNNPCLAAVAGTSVDTEGACGKTATGQTCGGLLGKTCPSGQYCDFPTKTQCGSGDQTGSCDEVPQLCSQIYAPVCGCDGKTHSSSCDAAMASTSVKSAGACL